MENRVQRVVVWRNVIFIGLMIALRSKAAEAQNVATDLEMSGIELVDPKAGGRVEPECSATKLCPLNACCSSAGSCGMTSDFCGAGCLSGCYTPSLRICGNPPVRNDMRYYRRSEQSRGAEEEFFRSFKNGTAGYTHITYAFTPIKDGMLASADAEEEELLSRLVELKRYSPNLKVMTSVGGWNFNNPGETRYEFSNTISSRRSRSRFIESVRDYLERNRLDGIDIAYQYPGAVDRGGTESDSRNYLKLMRELRRNLGRRYLITMVSPATFAYMQFFNIGPMSREVDWINLFAFDSHGMWDRENWFGNVIRPATEDKLMQASVDFLVHQGVQPEKILLGMPTFGRSYKLERRDCTTINICRFSGPGSPGSLTNTPGYVSESEIQRRIERRNLTPTHDELSNSDYMSYRRQWISFNTRSTRETKRRWAQDQCLKGAFEF